MESPKLGIPDDPELLLNDSQVEEVTEVSENSVDSSSSTKSDSSDRTSLQKYEDEWNQMFMCDDTELGELRRHAILGNLRACRFRSVCWHLLLGVLTPTNVEEWPAEISESRRYYKELKERLCVDPGDVREPVQDNPLSQDAESAWNQYFCDKELRSVIRQDVIRTFPGIDFFRSEKIQDSMVNVLFCYARDHPAMCYRQGMHEILAPLMFVLHCDHQALLHTKEQDTVNDTICQVLDPEYMEEDSYALFWKIMTAIKGSYQINDLAPTSTGYFPARLSNSVSLSSENQVLAQLNWIKEHLLAPFDPQLYQHLMKLDIPLPLFGIRWLRLLFGREFPLQDLLVLWDAIFAAGESFQLVNYIVVAMLIAIRHQLLNSDYTACLTLLMRYPATMDISYIIENALKMKDPQNHRQLAMSSVLTQMPPITVGGRPDLNRGPLVQEKVVPEKKSTVQMRQQQQHKQQRPVHLDKKYSRDKQVVSLTGRLKKLSTKPRWAGTPPTATPTNEDSVIDGYTLDDPAILHNELRHAHAVMALCRLKLLQYHHVLEQSVPVSSIQAQQALTGIHELCSLLDPVHLTQSPSSSSVEVEPAYEAGENSRLSMSSPLTSPTSSISQTKLPPPCSEVDMTIFKESQGLPIETSDNVLRPPIKR